MAGYIRQSTFSDGDTITAALFNNEYDQLLNVFSNTSGHKHDGTAAEGPVIGLIGDAGLVTPLNKILIDTTNDHIEFWLDVSGTSTQQLYIADGAILPVTDNDIDLGSSSLEFKDLFIDGTANIDSLVADTADINGGSLDNVTIGATTAAAGTFTTVDTSGNVTVGGNLTVSGTTTTVNSNEVNIGDNIIVLNSDETGTPSQNGGIEVERGTSTNVSLLWNETNDYWTFGSDHLNFPDNSKAYFGDSNDLQIFHNGSNSVIKDAGTGHLYIQGTNLFLTDSAGYNFIGCVDNGTAGTVTLYHNNSAKLATSQDGIDVTGHISVTGQSQAFKGVSISGTNPSVYFRDTEASNAWHVGQNGGILYFLQDTDANGAYNTISAFIDASNNFNVPNGDVGIGISTTPALQSGGSGLHIHDTNNSEIKFTNSTTGTTASDGIALVTSGSTFTINNREAGNITFGTSNTERVRIDSAGNVGVGTASPAVNLDVQDSSQAVIRAGDGSTVDMRMVADVSSGVGSIRTSGNTSVMGFFTGGSERLRIDSSGNVGIGTSSPSELLHVAGNALVTGNLTVNGNLTFGNAATDTVSFGADIDSHIIPDDDDTYDLGSASQQWRDLYLDGVAYLDQVGIGTTSPSSYWTQANDLVIAGSSNRGLTIQSGASANGRLVFTDQTSSNPGFTDGGQIHYDHTNDAMNLRTSGTDAITIDSSQNVGIGTTSPSRQLTLQNSGNAVAAIVSGTSSLAQLALGDTADDNYAQIILNNATNKLQIQNGGGGTVGERGITLDSSENVGIGTTSPNAKLEINDASSADSTGLIIANSYTTDAANDASEIMFRLYRSYTPSTNDAAFVKAVKEQAWDSSGDRDASLTFGTRSGGTEPTERMRIDSSGNLLVGQTSLDTNTVGHIFLQNGSAYHIRDGGTTGIFNRKTSDGTIVAFQKDGTTVGSIGTRGGDTFIASTTQGIRFYDAANVLLPTDNIGAGLDNTISLGESGNRFKDLYLGGNATIDGNLTVSGTTLTVNTTDLNVEDKNITINYSTGDSSSTADGAGITIQDAVDASTDASLLWDATLDAFKFSNTLHFDDGIQANFGTSSDLQILHDGTHSYIKDVGTGSLRIRGTDLLLESQGGETFLYAANNGAVTLYHDNSAKLATTSSGIDVTGSVVSDGLTVASNTDVISTLGRAKIGAFVSDYAYFSHIDNATSTNYALNQNSAGSTAINAATGQNVSLKINNSEKLLVQGSTGNVGIGTTSPSEKLHVNGNIILPYGNAYKGVGSTNDEILKMSFTSGVGDILNIAPAGNSSTGQIVLKTITGSSTSEAMRIHDNGAVTLNNASKLDSAVRLQSTGSSSGVTSFSTFADDVIFEHNNNIGITLATTASYAGTLAFADPDSGSAGWLQYDHASNNMNFRVNSAERMRIDSSGNLGIGTTSPNSLLEIKGSQPVLTIRDTASPGGTGWTSSDEQIGKIEFWTSDTTGIGPHSVANIKVVNDITAASPSGAFTFSTHLYNSSTERERLRITSSGNVGIGTTSPTQKLQVNGNIKLETTGSEYVFAAATASNSVDAGHRYNSTEEYVATFTGATERMRIDSSGNVAIGTTSATSAMSSARVLRMQSTGNNEIILDHTDGGVSSHIGILSFERNGDHLAHIMAQHDGATDSARIAFNTQATGGNFGSGLSSNERMCITSIGRVGIGTTSPNRLLESNSNASDVPQIRAAYNSTNYLDIKHNLLNAVSSGGNDSLIIQTASTERMRINQVGNVGIGTTSPSAKLHTQVTGASPAFFYGNDTWNYPVRIRNTTSGQEQNLDLKQGTGGASIATTGTALTFQTASTERARFTSTGLGIGTTSPSSPLHVDSTSFTAATFERNAGVNSGVSVDLINSDGNKFNLASEGTEDFNIGYTPSGGSKTNLFTLNSSGNVGIGTTSPSHELVLRKDQAAATEFSIVNLTNNASASTILRFRNTTSSSETGNGAYLQLDNYNTLRMINQFGNSLVLGTNNTEQVRIDSSGNVLVGTTSATTTDGSNIELSSATSSRVILDSTGTGGRKWTMATGLDGRLDFYDYDATAYRMSINSLGRVGIGTTSPDGKLDIAAPQVTTNQFTSPHLRLRATGTADNTGFTGVAYSVSTVDNYGWTVGAVRGSGSGNNSDFVFNLHNNSASGSEKMRIDGGTGNVGIGTTSPSAKLDIHHTDTMIRLTDSDGTNQYAQYGHNNGDTTFVSRNNTSHGTYSFYTHDGTTFAERMSIQSDGNVGIGTTSPSELLHISGTNSALRIDGGTSYTNTSEIILSNGRTKIDSEIIDGTAQGDTAIKFSNRVSGTLAERMRINHFGKVGIGTTSPLYKLHVQDSGNVALFGDGTRFFRVYTDSDEVSLLADGSVPMKFYTSGAEKMRIDTSGNVGIGTSSPDAKFHVNTGATGTIATFTGAASNRPFTLKNYDAGISGSGYIFDAESSFGAIKFQTTSTDRLIITNTGNVGIGTTSPSQELHVVSSGESDIRLQGSGSSNYLDIFHNSTEFGLWGTGTNIFKVGTNGSERMRIDSSGNVAIGATSATNKVEITANGLSKKHLVLIDSDNTTGRGNFFHNGSTTYIETQGTSGTGTLEIRGSTVGASPTYCTFNSTGVTIAGALSKGSGSFKIDHPLKPDTHHLVHSFVEGPQADNLYRGVIQLENGRAVIDLDDWFGMTAGTFLALNRDIQAFVNNSETWDAVRANVQGSQLVIECQNPDSNATVSWLVIGERQDKEIYESILTDDNGKIIVEPQKVTEE